MGAVRLVSREARCLSWRSYWANPAKTCEGVDPMGRGRAKAKQTKVARELKYRNYNTDFSELQRELHGDSELPEAAESTAADDDGDGDGDEFEDPYADLYDDESESASQR
jgi:Protein of unknown function (DUF3073)